MANEKVRCEDCKCWEPVGQTGRGDCLRHSPETSDNAMAYWPQPMYDNGCFDGIPREKEILND